MIIAKTDNAFPSYKDHGVTFFSIKKMLIYESKHRRNSRTSGMELRFQNESSVR